MVKIGMLMVPRIHPDYPEPIAAAYRSCLDDAVHAEQLGFDNVWCAEHHFSRDQFTPSPLQVLAALSQITSRIRLGTSVALLPFCNPLRLAEDAAVVDALSGGRLDLGLGTGSCREEFEPFGVSFENRLSRSIEAAEIIAECLDTGQLSHTGRFYRFENVNFTTKPVQDRLPMWWGGVVPKSVEAAARNGWHLIAYSPHYDDCLRKHGRDPADFAHGAAPQFICVGPTRDSAWDACEEGLRRSIEFYRERGTPYGVSRDGLIPEPLPPARELRNIDGLAMYDYDPTPMLIGAPEYIAEQLRQLVSRGRTTHLALVFRHPGMSTDNVRRSMDLFASEVMPALRDSD